MFEQLKPQPADKILTLMQAYREDPRADKIDLGVGVYKNAQGVTPVMRAIKGAEHRLWEEQETKSYVGLLGDPAFSDAMIDLVLGDAVPRASVAAAATSAAPLSALSQRAASSASKSTRPVSFLPSMSDFATRPSPVRIS